MRSSFYRQLPWRNGLALMILAVVAFGCYFAVRQTVLAQEDNAELITLLARQPLLAEEIGFRSWRLATSENLDESLATRADLEATITEFEELHLKLTLGANYTGDDPLPEAITTNSAFSEIYYEEPLLLNDQILDFIAAAELVSLTPDGDLTADHAALSFVQEQVDGRLKSGLQGALELQRAINEAEVRRQNQVLGLAILSMISAIVIVAALIIIPIQQSIRSRGQELIDTNQRLKEQNDAVNNLTRDMELAAEIGQVVTEIQDLDTLLSRAAELVRNRFELYYAQIYLTDPNRRGLIMRAGTGEVGRTLLDRGHRLAVAPNSINGIAAYEKRSLIVADTEASSAFRPNVLLPETRSEMAVPLLYQEDVIGILNLQSNVINGLNSASLPAFEAIAGQLAVAIINATLFEEAQQAQREMTEQARRLTEVGWSDFLNAVDRGETVGYVYDQAGLKTLSRRGEGETRAQNTYTSRISIAGTSIGYIQLTADPELSWNEEQLELVDAVSQQVARQLDNIRLLAEADRYREQADRALRRLTGQGWTNYARQRQLTSFIYDGERVNALPANDEDVATSLPSLVEPLQVRGETIGELAVNESDVLNEEAPDLISAIAERLAGHIENLRLSEQTESALSAAEVQAQRLAELNEFGTALSAAENLESVLKISALTANELIGGQWASLSILNPENGMLTIHDLDDDVTAGLVQREMPATGTAMEEAILTGQLLNFGDITSSHYKDNIGLRHLDIRSRIIAPLVTQNGVIGTINLGSLAINDFSQTDARLMQQMASLLAATLENHRLLTDAQRQAQRERMVNQITAKIQGARTIDGALQTAVEELGRVLHARKATVRIGQETGRSATPSNGTPNGGPRQE